MYTIESVQTVPAIKKKNGDVHTAHVTGSARLCTVYLMRRKIIAAKHPEMKGAMARPAKIAPKP